jgi:hypothetical protein
MINYNSADYTVACINSLLEHTSKQLKCQYIIVDNCSEAASYKTVKTLVDSLKQTTDIELIRSNINTGFGGGNMIGVQKARGKYLAFINNDTFLQNDCLSILFNFMNVNTTIGVVGPQAFTPEGKLLATLDHFIGLRKEILGRGFLEGLNPKKYPNRKKTYSQPTQGQWIAGSFMFFRSCDFFEVGGFDTNIFLYHEESDVCKRLQMHGKLAYLVPDAKFTHHHGASTEKSIAIKKELKISLLYVFKKHHGVIKHQLLLRFLQLKYLFSSILKPKNFPLFMLLLKGAPLSKSLKHKQRIIVLENDL